MNAWLFDVDGVITNLQTRKVEHPQIIQKIVEKLSELVTKLGLGDEIEVHQDTIAVNVKNKRLNKHQATKKFLEWLATKEIEPELFYVFGDSQSDLQIGEELCDQGKKVKFIYTGKDDLGNLPFEVVRPSKLYDEGTLEYLKSN